MTLDGTSMWRKGSCTLFTLKLSIENAIDAMYLLFPALKKQFLSDRQP